MKRPKPTFWRSCFSLGAFGLALVISASLGILIAQWQPSFFGSVAPWQVRSATEKERFVVVASRLFNAQESNLQPESLKLLDAISMQLPSTKHRIRVVSYINPKNSNNVLNLSYRRALAIKEYLRQRTGGDRYYWFAVGMNNAGPVGPDRIEVIVSQSN